MADEAIKITIGAVKTASVDRVFESIRRQAARIGQDLNRFLDPSRAMKGLQAYNKEIQATAGVVKAQQQRVRQTYNEEERQMRRVAREKERAERFVHSLRMRSLGEESRSRDREERRQISTMQRYARMTSWQAARSFGHGLNAAGRFSREIGRGIGLDLSPATYLQRAIANQSTAIKLSNAGYNPSDPRNNKIVPPEELQRDAMKVAHDLKGTITTDEILAGQGQYQKVVGDLKDTRASTKELSRITVATGSDAGQLFGTAGILAKQFENDGIAPEERQRLVSGMIRTFARQGQEGAVELEDLSKYSSRMVSSAGMYAGDKVDVIKSLGAIGQAARSFGGADSAAQAATSVAGLANTFQTGARARAFKKITGKSVFTDGGKVRDPIELIKDALVSTQGDPLKFKEIFANVMGARAANGIGNIYRGAYDKAGGGAAGKEAGLAAIDAFMEKMKNAQVSEEEISKKIDQVAQGYEAQVNELNTTFEEIATNFLHDFLPVLKEVSPELKKLGHTLGEVTTWVVRNPKEAIGAAIGISIAKAGLETAFRAGVERMFMGSNELLLKKLAELATGGAPGGVVAPGGAATKKVPFLGMGLGTAAALATVGLLMPDSAPQMTPEERRAKADNQANERINKILQSGDRETLSGEFGARINRQVFLDERLKTNEKAAAGGDQGARVRAEAYAKELAENGEALKALTHVLRNLPNGVPGVTDQAGNGNR